MYIEIKKKLPLLYIKLMFFEMMNEIKKIVYLFLTFLICFQSVQAKPKTDYTAWAVKIADSEIKHNPELWKTCFMEIPQWSYMQSLVAKAVIAVYNKTVDARYYNYVHAFADFFVNDAGNILTYNLGDYNIDRLNGGDFLFDMYEHTKEQKYLKAIRLLRKQFYTQPRASEGVFWHNRISPNQIWLDDLYMGSPFYARYAATFDEMRVFDDVMNQFMVVDKHTLDPKTGLNYHGWDESKTEKWSNPETGQSPNFWSPSMGWYMMAIVDVLDYLPINHEGRPELIKILNRLSSSLIKYQDKKTGMWYQVTNFPKRSGNYLESSGTAMFAYALAKGVNKGYLPPKYLKPAQKAFDGMIKYSTQVNADGTTSIARACSEAGLGGDPYRDGSYACYISEPIRNDDPKVIGPFIMAALELAK